MQENKATPGPWYVGGKYTVRTSKSSIDWICRTRDDRHGHVDAEDAANARLIAAAPDMYEALRSVLANVQCMTDEGYIGNVMDDITYVKARAAIAKAEGRE